MSSHRERVVAALAAQLSTHLPGVSVERDAPWPKRPPLGGLIIVRDGDPGEPEADLSPPRFTWTHTIELEVFAAGEAQERHARLDALLMALDAALAADRSLGGLCMWLEPASAPSVQDVTADGGQPLRSALLGVMAEYSTSSRLG